MAKRKQLDIEALAEQRMAAGIADPAEEELYFKGDLVDSEYSQEFKESLLQELEQSVVTKGPSSHETYASLLACTNEVVRLALSVRVRTYKGQPCIRITRGDIAWGRSAIHEREVECNKLFGDEQVREAKALLDGVLADLGDLRAISYLR